MLDRIGVVGVHMGEDGRFGRGQGRQIALESDGTPLDPADLAEARHQMGPFDLDPVELEIGEGGIALGRGMAGDIAGEERLVPADGGPADQARPGPGQGIGQPGRAVEEQGDPGLAGDIAAVLGQVGEQQQRRGVQVQGRQDQGGVGRAIGQQRSPAPPGRPPGAGPAPAGLLCPSAGNPPRGLGSWGWDSVATAP